MTVAPDGRYVLDVTHREVPERYPGFGGQLMGPGGHELLLRRGSDMLVHSAEIFAFAYRPLTSRQRSLRVFTEKRDAGGTYLQCYFLDPAADGSLGQPKPLRAFSVTFDFSLRYMRWLNDQYDVGAFQPVTEHRLGRRGFVTISAAEAAVLANSPLHVQNDNGDFLQGSLV